MNSDTPLKNWQHRLRVLSLMVDAMLTAGEATNPTDREIVDELAQAERNAREAYYDWRGKADKGKASMKKQTDAGPSLAPRKKSPKSEPGLVRRYRGSNLPGDPQLGVPSLSEIILAQMSRPSIGLLGVASPSLAFQFQNVNTQVLANEPQAKQSAHEFRTALIACTVGPMIADPAMAEIHRLIPLAESLIRSLG